MATFYCENAAILTALLNVRIFRDDNGILDFDMFSKRIQTKMEKATASGETNWERRKKYECRTFGSDTRLVGSHTCDQTASGEVTKC